MTNIFILSLTVLTNRVEMKYVAPVGVYNVEYNLARPELVMADIGIWRTSKINVTNNDSGTNTISFSVPPCSTMSFRLKKCDIENRRID